jgi:hypothetical protein
VGTVRSTVGGEMTTQQWPDPPETTQPDPDTPITITFDKYSLTLHGQGVMTAKRDGVEWPARDLIGDKLVLAMFHALRAAEGKAAELQAQLDAQIQLDDVGGFSEEVKALRARGDTLSLAAANTIVYLQEQESLLQTWQDRGKAAEAHAAEVERPLDAQMARLNDNLIAANAERDALRTRVAELEAQVEADKSDAQRYRLAK